MLMATCPVCNGTTRVPVDKANQQWKHIMAGYDKATDTFPCRNCGGQTMYGKATGQVRVRPDGTPCAHSYIGRPAGRCYTIYTCQECGDHYDIDSGD